jgi:hypothetical protein
MISSTFFLHIDKRIFSRKLVPQATTKSLEISWEYYQMQTLSKVPNFNNLTNLGTQLYL